MQTSVNRGLLGVCMVLQKVSAVWQSQKLVFEACEDSDGLCAGTVSKHETWISNYRIFVYQTHTWVIQGVFMEQEQAIDELRSTSSDQEASEIKYAKTMNISKLAGTISRLHDGFFVRSWVVLRWQQHEQPPGIMYFEACQHFKISKFSDYTVTWGPWPWLERPLSASQEV